MAKRRSKRSSDEIPAEPANNPFGALAALRGELPVGHVAPAPAPGTGHAEEPPKRAAKVVVRRETKGRGGKTVTRVTGLAADELEARARQIKKALGCGAKVEGPDLVLLGSLVDRVADWLEARGVQRVVRGN